MAGGHAEKAPSDAARWTECHLAVQLDREKGKGEDTAGPAALRGSMLHDRSESILAQILQDGWDDETGCARYIHSRVEDLDEDDARIVTIYCEKALRTIRTFNPGPEHVGVESRSGLWYEKGQHGTIDFWLYDPRSKTLHVRDLKTGSMRVDAHENLQLLIYAECKRRDLDLFVDVEKFSLSIEQPSLDHFSYWEPTVEEAEVYVRKVSNAAHDIDTGSRHAAPGESTCRWCPHKVACRARVDHLKLELVAKSDKLTDEEMSFLVKHSTEITGWINSAKQHIADHIDDFPDWKMVQGRNSRQWINEANAANAITLLDPNADPYVRKIVSPAQAEKLVGKGKLDDLIETVPGSPVLAPSDDRRTSIKQNIKEKLNADSAGERPR